MQHILQKAVGKGTIAGSSHSLGGYLTPVTPLTVRRLDSNRIPDYTPLALRCPFPAADMLTRMCVAQSQMPDSQQLGKQSFVLDHSCA